MTIRARIHQAEEGGYWAEVPSLPGCFTEGDTREETRANLRDAVEGWLLGEHTMQGAEIVELWDATDETPAMQAM